MWYEDFYWMEFVLGPEERVRIKWLNKELDLEKNKACF